MMIDNGFSGSFRINGVSFKASVWTLVRQPTATIQVNSMNEPPLFKTLTCDILMIDGEVDGWNDDNLLASIDKNHEVNFDLINESQQHQIGVILSCQEMDKQGKKIYLQGPVR